MTMNELLLRECRSFHAMIGRFEQIIKGMPELAIEQVVKEVNSATAPKVDAADEAGKLAATPDAAAASAPRGDGFCALKQASLFEAVGTDTPNGKAGNNPFAGKLPKNAEVKGKPARRRGTPGIDKAKAMENFRKIVNGREILDLKDVNLIFGYNETTSGTFISCAIKRGELMTIRYGQHTKFLAKDVKDFVKRWYAQEAQQGE